MRTDMTTRSAVWRGPRILDDRQLSGAELGDLGPYPATCGEQALLRGSGDLGCGSGTRRIKPHGGILALPGQMLG
jgi:hypothetical protein